MRIVSLEEHVSFPEMVEKIKKFASDVPSPKLIEHLSGKLADIAGDRLKSMDKNGISMQVLSIANPGADLVEGKAGASIAREYNDRLAAQIIPYPRRFAAFAHLPLRTPEAAAEELKRTVDLYGFKGALISGMTKGEFLDASKFHPVFEMAEQLDTPIYLHPGMPPEAVANAYYTNLPGESGHLLSIAGWGWHSETALHVLRLIVSGTFDLFPKLKLIIGHMGEMLPMMMARCDQMFKPGTVGQNKRSISQTLRDQVYITTSGVFTKPPFTAAMETFGPDRVLFSVDYPFSPNEASRELVDIITATGDHAQNMLHRNADLLLKLDDTYK